MKTTKIPFNERKTEDLVDGRLRKHGYYDDDSGIIVEKQLSDAPRIRKLLEMASKKGLGAGRPEFIIRGDDSPNFIVVIECKADTQKHASAAHDKPVGYAVDGVLLYASFLSKEFDVLAIAVSGQSETSIRISHFLHLRGEHKATEWSSAKEIVSLADYYEAFLRSDAKFRQDYNALLYYNRTLNHELQSRKVTEAERGFLISGILIALQNKAFKQSYLAQRTAKQLATSLLSTIQGEFETADLPQNRRADLQLAFSFIPQSPALQDLEFFLSFIKGVDDNVNAFMRTHEFYDTIGHFYVEFLRYANNDKGLGIVLTPHHIAELFAELAGVNKNSIVFDNCCGTAGLLIAAMRVMILDAGPDKKLQKRIKERQLYGLEFQPKIYALAVSNMILHGDGKTNIYRGDCFKDSDSIVAGRRPTIGLLNPPYKNKGMKDDKEELEFVLGNLDCLEPGGKCVAIVPITCATYPTGVNAELKKTLLDRHTLEAVMSMPIELFHNSKTNVVTCVMVFTAHQPHPKGKKTWFGYWRDDGLVKTKHRGRYDGNEEWPGIKNRWVNAFRNREVVDGLSVTREVTHKDEWCAEAYMKTDYGTITRDVLTLAVKRYMIGQVLMAQAKESGVDDAD